MIAALVLSLQLAAASSGASDQAPVVYGYAATQRLPSTNELYLQALTDLRAEALRLRAKDGGALTPVHLQDLQRRLDALNARYGLDRRS